MIKIRNDNSLNTKLHIFDNFILNYTKSNNIYPLTYTLLVTRRCPLKCKHCFNEKQDNEFLRRNELSVEEYEMIAKKLPPLMSMYFGGGEPFLRQDFSKIVTFFYKYCHIQWASVTTNGILQDSILRQTEEICKMLRGRKFVINFSLDGDKNMHDLIRGKGVYTKCLDTLKQVILLKNKFYNLSIGIVTTMNTINETSICDFWERLLSDISPDVISLLLVRQSPRDGEYLKNVDPKNYKKATEKLYELFEGKKNGNPQNLNSFFPFAFYDIINKTLESKKRCFKCYAGEYGAFIDYDGSVNPCEVIGDNKCSDSDEIMGNLRNFDYDFKAIWDGNKGKDIRRKVNNCSACEKCTHETEGISPSLYFKPNDHYFKERIKIYAEDK